ncbi:MAG: hypothetical protein KBF73_12495 [Flavobacteriales bacterium]|nr:hypothetical protein [Flavobacteriales bacterium]
MKTIFSFLFLACITISSCKKEAFEDAPFRCKIDGKEFIATKDLIQVSVTGGNNFYIQATRVANPLNDELYGEMKFDVVVDTIGVVELNGSNTWRWSNNGGDQFRSVGTDPGTLNITSIDFTAKRITGTFQLTAHNDSQTATRSITEGFFDLTW